MGRPRLQTESVFRIKYEGAKMPLIFNLHMKKTATFLFRGENGCLIEAAGEIDLHGLLFAPKFQDFSEIPCVPPRNRIEYSSEMGLFDEIFQICTTEYRFRSEHQP